MFDLLDYNNINLDITTETVGFNRYYFILLKVWNSFLWIIFDKVTGVLLDFSFKLRIISFLS
jgi:hypothetical protein